MKKILIVDDSTFARSHLRRIFEDAGYMVDEATSGDVALQKVASTLPDVITLDLLMPGMSGLETMKQLRASAPSMKVVVITADIQALTRKELLDEGATAFINKPIDKDELLGTLETILKEK